MQRIRDEVLSRCLAVVGHIPIPADTWERYVPKSFAFVANRRSSDVGPPLDEAAVMLHALRRQNMLFPFSPGSPVPNGVVFAIPKTFGKCRLIVNMVPVNRKMPEKPEKFSLPFVEVLALLAHVAQHGSSFFSPHCMVEHGVSSWFGRCSDCRRGGRRGALYVPYQPQ